MKYLVLSMVFVSAISILCCILIVKYLKLSIKYQNLKSCIKKISNLISSARYGYLYSRIEENNGDILADELSRNLNNLLESVVDRDVMINEYIEKEKEVADLKKDFIAALMHDIKVPIIAQDNTFDLLLDEKFGALTDIQKEAVVKLKTSNIDLKYLAEALLETYKIEHKGITVNKEKDVLLDNFIKEDIEQLSGIFEAHGKKINYKNTTGKDFCADIDVFLVKRVVNNLILNALSYSKNSDTIDILLSCSGENFSLTVKDYGKGIEKEELEKIFNKYYSARSNTIKSSTGLGLYLSNRIIKALGGKITVESEKDRGSSFTITLPLE